MDGNLGEQDGVVIGNRSSRGGLSRGNACFDASQYAFFGEKLFDEVELGGFVEDDDENVGLGGINDKEFHFSSSGDKEKDVGSLSDIDDLTHTFLKINKAISESRSPGVTDDKLSLSRESSSAVNRSLDQRILDADSVQEETKWWSLPEPSSSHVAESKPLYRASSYPQRQPLPSPNFSTETITVPKSSLTSYSLPRSISQATPTLSRHLSIPSHTYGFQIPLSSSNLSHCSASPLHLARIPPGLQYGNMDHFTHPRLPISNRKENHWLRETKSFPEDCFSLLPNLLPQQLPQHNSLMMSQMFSQDQRQKLPLVQPSFSCFSNMQAPLFSRHPSTSHLMIKSDTMFGLTVSSEQRSNPAQRGKPKRSHSLDSSFQRNENLWPQIGSKYMSAEEIDGIFKTQYASTHNNDTYIDDYYHQACLAKKSTISRRKHYFCPTSARNLPTHSQTNKAPETYLQVDALGRVRFPSIRLPRALLEDDASASGDNGLKQRCSVKLLEKEPMLAARITVEDGLCLLLDVDDIDRLLQFSQPQDGGFQLRRRREILLEGLAASLQLVDPLGPGSAGQSIGIYPLNDLVFLRIASLPKGRKLLSRFLGLLLPSSGLIRIVCMAIFRHLRFLFGGLQSDPSAAETTTNLARTVSLCTCSMDLSSLSACLAAIVCSSEQPPLYPLGGSAGDGASIIIKSALKRATELVTNPAINHTPDISLWQASFNSFFGILTKYCLDKYDNIMQSMIMHVQVGIELTNAIGREMPVELLEASLPHTDEHQRKLLLDFALRSIPVAGLSAYGGSTGLINS